MKYRKYKRFKIEEYIKNELKKWERKDIEIWGKSYDFYIFQELPMGNLYEGFLFIVTERGKMRDRIKKFDPYKEGRAYCPRLIIVKEDNKLFLKDTLHNKHILKTIRKINKSFLNKLRKALSDPKEENLLKLFDRRDIIEEFYILYKKSREYLLKNVSGISEEEKRREFVDSFMMQMLTLWYLQERRFFNSDRNYFVTKFYEIRQGKLLGGFSNYYEFLRYFFEKISNNKDSQYFSDSEVGRVVVVGPAVFLNGEYSEAVSIPDKCFYKEGVTEVLVNTPPKRVGEEVPLLNLFESRDWVEGDIDEYVLGSLYEKLMTEDKRKSTGAYYTPEEITSYICKNTIEPYLADRVNEKFGKSFENIDQVIESSDKKVLFYLFEQLKEIKILDPAVGSAHFLESAINVLVEIYEKIRQRARELGIKEGLKIKASDEIGNIKTIDFASFKGNDEKFKLLIKFFIILSRNIYGVDINPSALKVARARLFLTLAKHFEVKEEGKQDIFIRFPNVHFNLREGNSLVGYVEVEKEEAEEQLEFGFFMEEGQVEDVADKIRVLSELEPYLKEAAKELEIDGDIVKEVENLNSILSKKKISWGDFEKVLIVKEKLIKVLIASLNSQHAVPLNNLLREITDLFNRKLDEKFAKEYNIRLDDLNKIKTFHWIFEFPEVFIGRGGFDVVVGNPPWFQSKYMPIKEKSLYKMFCKWIGKQFDTFEIFAERSIFLLNSIGEFGFIVPYRFLANPDYTTFRTNILNRSYLKSIVDVGEGIFIGVTMPAVLLFLNKLVKQEVRIITDIDSIQSMKGIVYQVSIGSFVKSRDFLISIYATPLDEQVIKGIEDGSILFGEIFNNARGVEIGKRSNLVSQNKIGDNYKPFLVGEDISRYKILSTHYIKVGEPDIDYKKKSLYKGRKILIRKTGNRINAVIDHIDRYVIQVIYIFRPKDNRLPIGAFLLILNSKLVDWYLSKKLCEKRKKAFPHLRQKDVLILPIKHPLSKLLLRVFKDIADILLFLYSSEERENQLKDIVDFFDYQIADPLIYELYFKEKFAEDGLYEEPKEYLLSTVSKHLKPINYNHWANLCWKKQLEGILTAKEEKELEGLEKENIETVVHVYNSIKNDKEIQKWIEKIKSHKWVKMIEEKA